MPKTLVVGDSVAVGIGGAISGAQVFAQNSLRIDQMQSYFDRAIAAAGQGDTVIISAGYNSTGADGLSQADIALLQTNIDQLAAKGAHVVVAPLRETGMTGDYARLNGQTARSNTQLRGLRNATVADQCVATANGIAGGEIHGAYADLARICQAASTAAVAATGRAGGGNGRRRANGSPTASDEETDGQAQPTGEQPARSGGGFWDFLKSIWDMIIGFFTSIFGGGSATSTTDSPAPPPATGAQPPAAPSPDQARAQEQARGATPQTTVSGGQDVEENTPPAPPVSGPQVAVQR